MNKNRWRKVGSGYDIEYVYENESGVRLGSAYRGGSKWYPFTSHVVGTPKGTPSTMDHSTLASAKQSVEGLVERFAATA